MQVFGAFPLVRLRQLRDNPGIFWYYLMRFVRYKRTSGKYIPLYKNYTFLTPQETLNRVLSGNLSLARLNDGELGILAGFGIYPPDSDWTQRYSRALRMRLEEVLASERDDLLVAVPPPWVFLASSEEAKEHGVLYTMWTEARMLLHRFLKEGRPYGDANVFIPFHHEDFDWQRFHSYLSTKDVVIVTGGISKLFDVSLGRRTFFVETGKHDAFEHYTEIRMRLANLIDAEALAKKDTLIMASLGPTAGVLALDLVGEGWQVWDTGHFFRYADRQAFFGSRRVFTKQLLGRTPQEVTGSFEKCSTLYEAAQRIERLVMPQPLSHTNTTVVFERLELPELFSDRLRRGVWEERDFAALGNVLGSLHRALMGTEEVGMTHGDLGAHNIAVGEDTVYLFDSEAPVLAEAGLEASRYDDLAAFFVSACTVTPLKYPLKLLKDRRKYFKAFFGGYETSSGFALDANVLRTHTNRELCRVRRWQERYGYGRFSASLKQYVSCLITLRQMPQLHHD